VCFLPSFRPPSCPPSPLPPFFSTDPPPTDIYTLSLHDALPICFLKTITLSSIEKAACTITSCFATYCVYSNTPFDVIRKLPSIRSEEHTSELQSRFDLVCRLLLEKKKMTIMTLSRNIHQLCNDR